MRIYDVNLTGASAAESARAQEAQRVGDTGSGRTGSVSGGNGDRVEFSNALNTLSQALASSGSARSNRVQALAAQYQSGSYQADSLATSRAMIAEAVAGRAGQ